MFVEATGKIIMGAGWFFGTIGATISIEKLEEKINGLEPERRTEKIEKIL